MDIKIGLIYYDPEDGDRVRVIDVSLGGNVKFEIVDDQRSIWSSSDRGKTHAFSILTFKHYYKLDESYNVANILSKYDT